VYFTSVQHQCVVNDLGTQKHQTVMIVIMRLKCCHIMFQRQQKWVLIIITIMPLFSI